MTPETRSRVYAQLKIDEGVKYEIYFDHLGFKTFGIGHLCTPDDPEFEQGTATPVSPQRVRECFENQSCRHIATAFVGWQANCYLNRKICG